MPTLLPLLAQTDAADGAALGVTVVAGVIGLAALVWYIWLVIDMSKLPDAAWAASGQKKELWRALWVVGLVCGGSLIIGLVYQFAIRPKVRRAAGV